MVDLKILPKLSKEYILKHISEQEIFAKYLGVLLINEDSNLSKYDKSTLSKLTTVYLGQKFINPLREDIHPTCEFYYSKDNRLRFRDFAGFTCKGRFTSWDVFDLLEYIINTTKSAVISNLSYTGGLILDLNSDSKITIDNVSYNIRKLSFAIILDRIAKDFNIHNYALEDDKPYFNPYTIKYFPVCIRKMPNEIEITIREWNNEDYKYWKRYNLDIRTKDIEYLKYFKVYPVLYASLNKSTFYKYNKKDICYAYHLGIDTYFGINKIKLYFPFRREHRFMQNCSEIQGIPQYMPAPLGIITKSYKDVIAMRKFKLFNQPVQAIAPASETSLISFSDYIYLRIITPLLISLFDFDYTGVRLGILYYKIYGIEPLFFVRHNKISLGEIKRLYNEFGVNLVHEILKRPIYKIYINKDFTDNINEIDSNLITFIENKYKDMVEFNNDLDYEYFQTVIR